MKGVILAGGTGSRLDPLTRITNKHLLPVYDKPMVMYATEALREAGVEELMLVTGGEHVEDFRRLFGDELEYGNQERPGGIAEALGLARDFVGGERVVVMLADNIFRGSIAATIENFRNQGEGARVLLAHVRETEHLRHLGVPRIEDGRITEIVEKPDEPPGRLAVTGLYCYEADVFDVVAGLEPSGRGELEITDVNNHYVRAGTLEYDVFEGYWGDAGESIEAYYEVIERVRRPHFGSERLRPMPLRRFEDERGWLTEIARTGSLPKPIRQTNVSFSRQGTIRGLHYHERGQDDLFVCLQGRARVVALDRETGEAFSEEIGEDDFAAVYVPGNLAHGFEALTDVLMLYHVTEEYDPADPDEHELPWDDPRVAHLWSTQSPILSERDSSES
ncbi:MAG: glucose-phosphate thymidylyltransferase [Gaiellaceae bacterium]|jgi:glucose-1-phosphate thymidylyltransferase|nr:glucose-phosphate thymidylyltransferase [Gaiellaceae bacterium]